MTCCDTVKLESGESTSLKGDYIANPGLTPAGSAAKVYKHETEDRCLSYYTTSKKWALVDCDDLQGGRNVYLKCVKICLLYLVLISSYAKQAAPTLATCPVNGLDFESNSKIVLKTKCSDDGMYTI